MLPQVKGFEYLRVLFAREDRMKCEVDRWIGGLVHQKFTKFSIYHSFYFLTLTYGHKLWVVTKRKWLK